jgi:hypothetical protein
VASVLHLFAAPGSEYLTVLLNQDFEAKFQRDRLGLLEVAATQDEKPARASLTVLKVVLKSDFQVSVAPVMRVLCQVVNQNLL